LGEHPVCFELGLAQVCLRLLFGVVNCGGGGLLLGGSYA